MSGKLVVQLASASSALCIFGALFGAFIVYNDIQSLYVDIMSDMADFRVHAEDAWQKMLVVQGGQVSFIYLIEKQSLEWKT
jgi:hypothetical protein